MVRSEAMGYAVTLFVMGLFLRGVDNAAHAGGFLGGYLAGLWLDPLKPERMDHLVGAVACLAATALAIVASMLTILGRWTVFAVTLTSADELTANTSRRSARWHVGTRGRIRRGRA